MESGPAIFAGMVFALFGGGCWCGPRPGYAIANPSPTV